MHKKIQYTLKVMLLFGAVYLFFDSSIHFFDIKLLNVSSIWSVSAIAYARLLDKVSGAFILLSAVGAFILHKNLEEYRKLVYLSAVWTFFLGLTFIYLSLSTDYSNAFSLMPSLAFWLPFYGQYLLLEAAALIFYSAVVYLWFRSKTR